MKREDRLSAGRRTEKVRRVGFGLGKGFSEGRGKLSGQEARLKCVIQEGKRGGYKGEAKRPLI